MILFVKVLDSCLRRNDTIKRKNLANGKVVMEPATLDVKELEGILYKPGRKAVSIEEMGWERRSCRLSHRQD
ncbi:MAG: hypothetical protein M1610_07660 [Nitrospirae bacterium]|nr:hypothetical protein [Nitrospirota bacterium]MDA8338645.1 hypothetical protein [Nitrospiraceae bacterium]